MTLDLDPQLDGTSWSTIEFGLFGWPVAMKPFKAQLNQFWWWIWKGKLMHTHIYPMNFPFTINSQYISHENPNMSPTEIPLSHPFSTLHFWVVGSIFQWSWGGSYESTESSGLGTNYFGNRGIKNLIHRPQVPFPVAMVPEIKGRGIYPLVKLVKVASVKPYIFRWLLTWNMIFPFYWWAVRGCPSSIALHDLPCTAMEVKKQSGLHHASVLLYGGFHLIHCMVLSENYLPHHVGHFGGPLLRHT